MTCCDNPRCLLTPGDPRHGTENGYKNRRCRCRPCRDANTEYMRRRIARDADPCMTCKTRVVYAKGECRNCYRYRLRHGVQRPARPRQTYGPPRLRPPRQRRPKRPVQMEVTELGVQVRCPCGWRSGRSLNREAVERSYVRHVRRSHRRKAAA